MRNDFTPAAIVLAVLLVFAGIWRLGDKIEDLRQTMAIIEAPENVGLRDPAAASTWRTAGRPGS